jgi:hypothetical protein
MILAKFASRKTNEEKCKETDPILTLLLRPDDTLRNLFFGSRTRFGVQRSAVRAEGDKGGGLQQFTAKFTAVYT